MSKKEPRRPQQHTHLLHIRLRLIEYASTHTLEQLLTYVLDQVSELVESPIAYYHFVDEKKQMLSLQQWSTRTLKEFCKAVAQDTHYPVEQAGVWVDCVKQRKPVIHNDYESLPHKKGLPAGHPPILREMVVPVFRDEAITAILGVGNKAKNYTKEDEELVHYLADVTWDIVQQKRFEAALVASKREWEQTFDAIPDIITIQDREMRILRANKAAHKIFDAEFGMLNGRFCYEVFRGSATPCEDCPRLGYATSIHKRDIVRHPGIDKLFHVTCSPIVNDNGDINRFVHIAKDVTEQKKLEEDLFQAHKLEAIGTLAGGIAHDFNNILTAILGFAEMARYKAGNDSQLQADLEQISSAGNRAKDLVSQILTFSRKKEEGQQPINPSSIIKEAVKMVRASLPSTIEIRENIDVRCGTISANPTGIHQILVNLCTNALHAMQDEKGVVEIELTATHLKHTSHLLQAGKKGGTFVKLSLRDNGIGMEEAVMKRIFEPYFTTKEAGHGTGMGLAVVHGLVEGFGGFIHVESTLGKGSAFDIYFPQVGVQPDAASTKDIEPLPRGDEHILVVDDEPAIITMFKQILGRLGYKITASCNSKEIWEIFQKTPQNFDLLITDQTMPGLTGMELAARILKIRSDFPVILCTGHSTLVSEEQAIERGVQKYLIKPVDPSHIAETVRELLDVPKN